MSFVEELSAAWVGIAVLIVVVVAASLIWWSKKTRGGRTAPKK